MVNRGGNFGNRYNRCGDYINGVSRKYKGKRGNEL